MPSTTAANETSSEQGFLDCFLQQIFHDLRWMPKVQLERIVGPLVTPFIGRLMSKVPWSDEKLRGEYKLVCEEFPLLIDHKENHDRGAGGQSSFRSTNVDWLLYNTKSNNLLFLELKTNDANPRDKQLAIYRRARDRQKDMKAKSLYEDVVELRDAKSATVSRRLKYEHLLWKIDRTWPKGSSRPTISIVYLVPQKSKFALENLPNEEKPDVTFSFKELPELLEGKHSANWSVIHKYLLALDDPTNEQSIDLPTLSALYD